MTPLLQLLPEDDNYREFEMHSPADLIQEILSLREEKAELHREVEVVNKKLKEVELVCNLAEELRQKLRKREMEAKELRSEKAGLEVRLKQAEKNAIRLKTALSEQEGKANARVQQLLHYSQLSGQFHRSSQL
jgi:chromosome segregation ATPase